VTTPADTDEKQARVIRRLVRSFYSTDSYGLVMAMIVVTYVLSIAASEDWVPSLVLAVQIGTVWLALHTSGARRRLIGSEPFFGTTGDDVVSNDLFFSFVTLTTTGYGDLVPTTEAGQGLAVLEALLGQLFLVTAVAKIVTAWRPRAWRQPAAGSEGE
jgi:hypothetical protein